MGTVKLKESQWRRVREVVREREARGPRVNPAELSPKNKQYVRVTTSEADENGLYDGVWYQTDHEERDIVEKNEIKILPVGGFIPDEGVYYEGTQTGTSGGVPVFSIISPAGNFPNFLRMVTNVCDISGTSSFTLPASVDAVVDSEAGINTASGTYPAKRGPTKIKAAVTWIDPDYESSSGDSFSFKLFVNSTELTGAPIYTIVTIGGTATIEKQMEWPVNFDKDGDVELVLLCYRVSGSRSLVAQAGTTRIEIAGLPSGIRTEYRQITLPPGVFVGPEVCIDRPTDCCVDDQSSDTSSRDTSSDSYPWISSPDETVTCIDDMGWRGLGVHGIKGIDDAVQIPSAFEVEFPTFTAVSGTWVPPSGWSGVASFAYDECNAAFVAALSGRKVTVLTNPDGTMPNLLSTSSVGTFPLPSTPPDYGIEFPPIYTGCGYAAYFVVEYNHYILGPTYDYILVKFGLNAVDEVGWGNSAYPSGTPETPTPKKLMALSIIRIGPATPYGFPQGPGGSTLWFGRRGWLEYFFDEAITLIEEPVLGLMGETQLGTPPKMGIRASGNITVTPLS